jgi:hypothetical protein
MKEMKETIGNIVGFLILAVIVYFSFRRVINSAKQGGCGGCGGCSPEKPKDDKEKGRKS